MSKSQRTNSTHPRAAYSRLICLGCRDRRIRCELPSDVERPDPGELRMTQSPCYRCKRLGIPCIIRQTVLGRPNNGNNSSAALVHPVEASNAVSCVIIELPKTALTHSDTIQKAERVTIPIAPLNSSCTPLGHDEGEHWKGGEKLLIRKPQSTETVVIIRAMDTLQYMRAEGEWFRHLPRRVGHVHALDLSIKALVAACAYARDVPKLTAKDCYQALALALRAVHASFKKQNNMESDDNMLAATALLTHFEGVANKHAIPSRVHVHGLAAILTARPSDYPVSQLAREIFDFHVCDSAIMACITGTPSPFEKISRAYFANKQTGRKDSDWSLLKALGSELFVRIPRLIALIRSLRCGSMQQKPELLDQARRLLDSLLGLQDVQAETRVMQNIKVHAPVNTKAGFSLGKQLLFSCVDEFEALAYYWQNRLCLLRLAQRLYVVCSQSDGVEVALSIQSYPGVDSRQPDLDHSKEMIRMVANILMCAQYVATLPLRKHARLFDHAILMVWGAVMSAPGSLTGFGSLQDGDSSDSFRDLLRERLNSTLTAKPPLTNQDVDHAAEMFVGGKLKGRFIELYSRSG